MYVPKKHYSCFLLNVSVNTFHAGEQHKGERLCSECQKHESNNQLKAQHVFRCDATSKEAAVMVEALPILRVISQLFWTGFPVSSWLRYLSICSVHFELRALLNKLFNKPPNAKSTDCRACLRTWYTPLANSAMMRSRWSPHEAACTLANHGPTWRASNTTIQSRMKRMRVLTHSHRANQATVRSTIQTIDVGGPLLFYVPPNKISCPVRHWIGGHCTSADLSRRSNKNISQG